MPSKAEIEAAHDKLVELGRRDPAMPTEGDYYVPMEHVEAALEAAERIRWIPLPPHDTWLRTRREGEEGENVCCMLPSFNDEEWIERDGGRTTVTHHSFAAPTHWQPLSSPPDSK